jgi:hypothetical protein
MHICYNINISFKIKGGAYLTPPVNEDGGGRML